MTTRKFLWGTMMALALVASAPAPARAQAPPPVPGPDDEALRLRALVEALERELADLRVDVARLTERVARLEAERARGGEAPGAAEVRIPDDARLRFVLEVALPRLAPAGLAQGRGSYAEDPDGIAAFRRKWREDKDGRALGPLLGSGELAAAGIAGYVGPDFLRPGEPKELFVVLGLELPGGTSRSRVLSALRDLAPFSWVYFGEACVLFAMERGTLGAQFAQAFERAAGPGRFVHASAYDGLVVDAAKADLAGDLGPDGFTVRRPPAPDGFFAQALGGAPDLRVGDVVRAVNGIALEPGLTAAGLYARLKTASRLELVVVRDGGPVRVQVDVPRAPTGAAQPEPASRPLSRAEQETLLQALELQLSDVDACLARGGGPALAKAWAQVDDTLRNEARVTTDDLQSKLRLLRKRRDETLDRARNRLLDAFRQEGARLQDQIEYASGVGGRLDPRAVLDHWEHLEKLAAWMVQVDASFAPVAADLTHAVEPRVEYARKLAEVDQVRIDVSAVITAGDVAEAIVNGHRLTQGEDVLDAAGKPIPGLRVAGFGDGRVVFDYKGLRFERASDPRGGDAPRARMDRD